MGPDPALALPGAANIALYNEFSVGRSLAGGPILKCIVVDLYPIPVGVLQVDLFDLVRADLGLFAVLGPVAVLDLVLVQVFGEGGHGGDAKGEVYVDIVRNVLFGAGDHVELSVLGDPEPDVPAIVEGFGYFFELHDFFIEFGASIQVCYKDGLVAETGALCVGGNDQQESGDQ